MELRTEKVQLIQLTDIREPTESVRSSINPDSIRELAESIKAIGLQNPIILRGLKPPYEITSGHRRFLAFKMLGLKKIPAIVRDLDDERNFLARAVENIQREDLSIVEEGKVYKWLRERYNLSLRKIAAMVGRGQVHVKDALDTLKTPEFVQQALHEKKIAWSAIRPLLYIEDEDIRNYYLKFAVENGVTRKVSEEWVKAYERMKEIEQRNREKETIIRQKQEKPTYMACAACKEPVDINLMKIIYMCPGCYKYIMEGVDAELQRQHK